MPSPIMTNQPRQREGSNPRRAHRGPPAVRHEGSCASCGTPTTLPFKPTAERPGYCPACFRNRRAAQVRETERGGAGDERPERRARPEDASHPEVFAGLDAYRDALLMAGARHVHLAGSGPALFALGADEDAAQSVHARLRLPGGRAFVVRTLPAAEALRREG